MARSQVVNIRLAARDDVPAIAAIANWHALHSAANFAVAPEPVDAWLSAWDDEHVRLPWYVALRPEGHHRVPTIAPAGEIIGFAKASPFRTRCAYGWAVEVSAYVDGAFHGMRIGTNLYEHVLNVVRRLGYCTAIAGITMPNEASVRLHESFGFVQVAVLRRIGWKFDRWHDVSYWELELRDAADRDQPPGSLKNMAQIGH